MADKDTNAQIDESTRALIESITAEFQKSMMSEFEARLSALSLTASSSSSSQQQPATQLGSPPLAPPPSSSTQTHFSSAPQAPGTPQTGFEATVNAIITHTFNPYHLWKLDPRYQEKNQKKTLQLIGNSLEIASDETALKDFKDITSLMIPLQVYFGIVVHYAPPSSAAALAKLFFQYTANLHKVASEYTWAAVVNYHVNFFLRRRQEMRRGYYDLWARQDSELASEFLHAHRKSTVSSAVSLRKVTSPASGSVTVCRNFNAGKCTAAVCPWNRSHTCSLCGKSDHHAQTHPKTT
ncbi:hypothetical protein EST38_g14169 [Candolleomyces aberdarensis]|uniref:Uncharacterized protein n=1 Tax=Candolleomyces aberdarensis TaxID=2316362 RepID=A0A4Q2CZT8_9AGAR|nr:hypothetical protein EST38_g14169 [Candolleomyces aberdarensis]